MKRGTCVLIDAEISGDKNVIKKEAQKIPKYKNVTIEIERMWNNTNNNRGDWDYFKVI